MFLKRIFKNLLLVNDMHAGRDNLQEFAKNWEEMVQVAIDNDAEVLLGGDLFLSRSSQTLDVLTAVRKATEYADLKDVKVWAFPGNHDLVDQTASESYLDFFPLISNRSSGVLEMEHEGKLTWVYFMRYWPEPDFAGCLSELTRLFPLKDDGIYRILYCHEGIRGGLSQATDEEVPTSVFEGFDKVLVGHYHDRKKIPGTNIQYIGASRQHNFGEDAYKGYTLITQDGKTKFIRNNVNTRYETLVASYENYTKVPELIADFKDKNYRFRVNIICTQEEAKTVNRDILLKAGVNKIVFDTESGNIENQGVQSSLTERFDKNTLTKEYEIFCGDKGKDPQPGIQYLTQIQSYHVEDKED